MSWDVQAALRPAPWQSPGGIGQLLVIGLPLEAVELSAYTMACLSDQDLQRASKFARSKDAIRYMASRAALRSTLARACHCAPRDVPLTTQDHGKPILMATPGAVHFNLTHSDSWALIVLHPDRAVGIDLELHRPVSDLEELTQSVFSPKELATWPATPPEERTRVFYSTWTRKEACLKAIGTGLLIPAEQVDIGLLSSPEQGSWRNEGGHDVHWMDLPGLPIAEEHSACVAWCAP